MSACAALAASHPTSWGSTDAVWGNDNGIKLAYSDEQGYKLALAPINDKSDNPGHESVIGVYSSS